MFPEYFGLRGHPFQMTPDARLFFASAGHSRAQAHLAYGIAQREGFIIVTGEVGAGKTTLIEHLCAGLDKNLFAIARIATTQVSGDDLLRLVADAFGAPAVDTKAAVLRSIFDALRAGAARGRRHLLIVDEAQALSQSALEELRMLSNATDGSKALLQTILLGQPQLRKMLASPDLDQLRQRVIASCHLGSMSSEETHAYVEHRLRGVGWTGRPSWEGDALERVHRHAGGIPRRINRLCSRILLDAALEGTDRLTPEAVNITAGELEDDLSAIGGQERPATTAAGDQAEDVPEDLLTRLDKLEQRVLRREQVLDRLSDLFREPPDSGENS